MPDWSGQAGAGGPMDIPFIAQGLTVVVAAMIVIAYHLIAHDSA